MSRRIWKKNEINEIIVLSHFQNSKNSELNIYFPSEYVLDEKSQKESKKLAKKEKKLGFKPYKKSLHQLI